MPKKKECTVCGKPKLLTEYNRRAGARDGRRSQCRDCDNKRCRQYYHKNRRQQIDRVIARRKRLFKWLRKIKRTQGCRFCEEADPICLDFHHRLPTSKEATIPALIRRGAGRQTLIAEIQKCDVVCANCHRKLHRHDDS